MNNVANTMHTLAQDIVEGRRQAGLAEQSGMTAHWKAVLDNPQFWSLHADAMQSPASMSDDELVQSVVEDLLYVAVEIARGAAGSYPVQQPFRHLGAEDTPRLRNRIAKAVEQAKVLGFAVAIADRACWFLPPERLADAMAFSGVFWDLDEQQAPDMVDAMLSTGGVELLVDAFEDLADKVGPTF